MFINFKVTTIGVCTSKNLPTLQVGSCVSPPLPPFFFFFCPRQESRWIQLCCCCFKAHILFYGDREGIVSVCVCVCVCVSVCATQSFVSIVIEFQHLYAVQLNGSQNGWWRMMEGVWAGFFGMTWADLKMLSCSLLRRHIQWDGQTGTRWLEYNYGTVSLNILCFLKIIFLLISA
jgi:hypothetical protein